MPGGGRARRGRQAGFTLIEMMIALLVFAFGMVTLSAMQLHSVRGANQGRHATHAAAIAETRMERMQRLTWAQIAPTAGWAPAQTETSSVQGQAEKTYSVDWRITDLEPGWTRSIDVRVTWDEPGRLGRSVVISSVRFNREGV